MFTAYKNGAEQEAEIVTRYENGAEVEAEAVYAYKNGAEVEVWCAIKYMSELANTLSSNVKCNYATSNDYKAWNLSTFYDGNASGYVTYYLEGDFSNPTVSFSVEGFFNYMTSSGSMRYASAGTIDLYTRTADGSTIKYTEMGTVGSSSGDTSETFEETLTGDFDRIGFRVTMKNWGNETTCYDLLYNITIWNFLIDGKECLPSKNCVID